MINYVHLISEITKAHACAWFVFHLSYMYDSLKLIYEQVISNQCYIHSPFQNIRTLNGTAYDSDVEIFITLFFSWTLIRYTLARGEFVYSDNMS